MRIHFIAIGGSAMHNLAIALHNKGYQITGSDDEIFEPSKSRLKRYGILPERVGWYPETITDDIDAVILGMHAKADNPELAEAQRRGIRVFSYPGFLFEQTKDKQRVVIGGSHGKTTITSMILHVLTCAGIDADYMVGAQLDGFEVMVKLTNNAKIVILEGDEYLTSALDRRPKFHVYKPHIGLISGIAWDHINVFPTFEEYVEQFRIFAGMIPPEGKLIYFNNDPEVQKIAASVAGTVSTIPYGIPDHRIGNGITFLISDPADIPLRVFGEHNLANIGGAEIVCRELGVQKSEFLEAISSFAGASKRLEKVASGQHSDVFKDFAHSPSKLRATIHAVKRQYPDRKLVACMELHTYSSLSDHFIDEYHGAMDEADTAIVYYNPHALEIKKLPPVPPERIIQAFGYPGLKVFTSSVALQEILASEEWSCKNLLLMSSGDFDGIDLHSLAEKIVA